MHPATQSAHRVVLVRDGVPQPSGPRLRRYKLARLRLNDPPSRQDPFAHLRRSYD